MKGYGKGMNGHGKGMSRKGIDKCKGERKTGWEHFPVRGLAALLVCAFVFTGCGRREGKEPGSLGENTGRAEQSDISSEALRETEQSFGAEQSQETEQSFGAEQSQETEQSLGAEQSQGMGHSLGTDSQAEDGLVRSLAATVEIEAGNRYGSGVIYEKKETGLILVTAAHVIAPEAEEISVVFRDGTKVQCSNSLQADEADFVFLVVEGEALPKGWQEKYGTVEKDRERFDNLECGEGVFLADHRAENDLGCRFAIVKENWIYVEDFSQHMMLLSGEAGAGMSGSGVFDVEGCFLGILCGGNEEGELAVLPYSVIASGYSQLGPE